MMRTHRRDTPGEPAVRPAMRIVPPPRKPSLPRSRELLISPAALPVDEELSGGSGPDFIEIRHASLKPVVSKVWDMPEPRIDWPSSLDPDARYDFVLVLPRPESHAVKMHLMQDGIARHVRVRITTEVRPKNVYVLTAPNGIRARPVREDPFLGFVGTSRATIDIGATPQERARQGGHPPVPAAIRLMKILDPPLSFGGTVESPEAFEDMWRRIKP